MNIQTKLTLLLLAVNVTVIVGLTIFSTISLDNYFRSRLIDELKTQAHQAEFVIRTLRGTHAERYVHLQQYVQSAGIRLTLIDRAGNVLFESEKPHEKLSTIENHLQRPEVQEALRSGSGTTTRHNTTINTDLFYFAKKISESFPSETGFGDAAIIRVAMPLTTVNEMMSNIQRNIILASVVVLGFVIVITLLVSRKIARPIQEMASIAEEIRSGNLQQRIPVRSGDEFGKLSETLNSMVDKLNEDINRLKKLERVRSEFLGNVSHELRTPIFAIQGMLETLLQGAIDDKEVNRDFVERALRNTQNLNTLLGDLIEISRIESGEMKMSFRYFPLREFLQQIIAELQPIAQQKNITLTLKNPTTEVEVLGDRERLKTVFVNLIDNAIKYTAENGAVEVSFMTQDNTVKVSVKDTGIGIAQEHLPRIFERFYRVDKERSREAGGTGLGLAIVKHIVEAHGSKVEVQSEVGKGSTFSFVLKT